MEVITENQFLLLDRIQKIQSINQMYDLQNNSYISYSGGKDSTVLSNLMDEALPGNRIPRVYINTGIEYLHLYKYVLEMQKKDDRIIIINSGVNIKKMLEEKGYPFKSKEHSEKLHVYQNTGMTEYVKKYIGLGNKKNFLCPEKFKYQFTPTFTLKVSRDCCNELKKKVAKRYIKESGKTITITGMRRDEGGARNRIGCIVVKEESLKKFHPLSPMNEDWIEWYVKERNIQLCDLYYPPFNFKRTGCKGCPYALDLQEQLDVMKKLLPSEYKQCEYIWGPAYKEYRKIGYRLRAQLDLPLEI